MILLITVKMKSVNFQIIKEIADQLDCGFRAYCHTTNGQLLFIPDFDNNIYAAEEPWEEELKQLEDNFDDYKEIEKWNSHDSFEIMKDFALELSEDKQLQEQLLNALEKKKPFREFKSIIDNAGAYREQWFEFKSKRQQEWVSQQFNIINQITNSDKEID